jgi:tetratricopeptide (TPR) repeat protein
MLAALRSRDAFDVMLIDWLIGVLIDFRQAGPINQISLLLGIGVVCGGAFGLLHRWRRSGFERLEKEIAELKRRLESALVRASHLKAEKRELEEQLATISARDLWSLMLRAENERKEGNEEVALGLFRRAVENTAPEMAEAALQLAQVHLSVFGDSEDAEHLVAADRYARIARNLVPDHQQARGVLAEVDAFSGRLAAYDRKFDLAGEHWDEADIFSRGVDGLTGRALVARLIEAAWRNIGAGHYYLAFALARRASMLADRGLAIDDLMRLDAGHCLGVCLERLGNYAAARERFEVCWRSGSGCSG